MTLPFAATSRSEPYPAAKAARLERSEGTARIAFKRSIDKDHGGAETRLARLHQSGAAKVRLPRVPAGAPPEAVLINTAGGLTSGDRMTTEVSIESGCRAVVTTQACEKIYRAVDGETEIATRLALGDKARLDYLPQETILFDGARLRRSLEAELAADAELLVVEAVILGRRARGESVGAGLFSDRWRIRRDGRLIFADDIRFDWADPGLTLRPAVLAGAGAMATLLFVTAEPEHHLEMLRAIFGGAGGVSAWNRKLLARFVAPDGAALRRALIPAIAALLNGNSLPRIWQS